MNQPGDDAQRDLEQRALRNVRGLLDKVEEQDLKDKRTTMKMAVACAIVAVVGFGLLLAYANRKPEPSNAVMIPAPAKAAR